MRNAISLLEQLASAFPQAILSLQLKEKKLQICICRNDRKIEENRFALFHLDESDLSLPIEKIVEQIVEIDSHGEHK